MNALSPIPMERPIGALPAPVLDESGDAGRWTRSLGLILAVHALPLLIAVYWLGPVVIPPVPEPAVLIDMAPLAPEPAAPQPVPAPPTPVETARPSPAPEPPRPAPAVTPAVSLPQPPPPAPRSEARPVEQPVPPRPAPPAPSAAAAPTWQGLVLGQLNRVKRYPVLAQSRRQQGTPWIRFVMDRAGKVLSARLEKSSGHAILDQEAVSLPKRAQPLPKPPEDVAGETVELVVPVEFFLN